MREKNELIKRYGLFVIGIWFNALGVAFLTKSMLGTGPSTCIPYVVSLKISLTLGECNFIYNLILLALQILILRGKFDKYQLLQLPVSFVYSAFIDIAMSLLKINDSGYYFIALIYVLAGCVFRGLGASCQVLADVVMLSPEALAKALADVNKRDFAIWKVISDAVMTAIAAVMSLSFFGNIQGIREGTLITVILVGPVCHFFTSKLKFTNYYLENEGKFVYEPRFKLQEGKKIVITITSEAGSGGRVIARILGEKMNLPVYNKEIIGLVSEDSGLSKEYVTKHDERLYTGPVDKFIKLNYNLTADNDDIHKRLFESNRRVIRSLADEQDCIIVGHCSNYILDDYPGALHFHVSAEPVDRIRYIMDKYDMSESEAYDKILTQDEDTYQYYMKFTGRDWKDAAGYHMSMNSSLFGYEGTADIIETVVKRDYGDIQPVSIREVIEKYRLN